MIKENHILVNKTARYYTLGELSSKTKQVWFVIHGYRQNAKDFLAEFEPLANESTFFIAPEALNRMYIDTKGTKVGATWMTREDRLNEIKDYIQYLDDLYEFFDLQMFSVNIVALGFSQGASTLTRWINHTHLRIDNAIVYAGEVAPELLPLQENSGLKRTQNFYILGTEDEFLTPALMATVKDAYKELNFKEIMFEGAHVINLYTLKGLIP